MKSLILRDHEVRRLLDAGSATVVREVTKPPRARETWAAHSMRRCPYGDGWSWHDEHGNCHNCDWTVRCPIGDGGEQRWVRETAYFWTGGVADLREVAYADDPEISALLRDAETIDRLRRENPAVVKGVGNWRRRSAAQMPRWASRAVVEVASVRVARVQDLTDADAVSAGVEGWQTTDGRGHFVTATAREVLADRVAKQATGSIDGNPWVWVASVSRVEVSG